MIDYRAAKPEDIEAVTSLLLLLLPDNTWDGLIEENIQILANSGSVMFLALDGEKAIGFSHCEIRCDYVEGTNGGNVGYLEGVYVLPEYRSQGIAKTLVLHGEDWARKKGCTEFGSDCELDNIDSYRFHMKIGFAEANKIICFTKRL